jgi:hypothetical protein
MKSYCFL